MGKDYDTWRDATGPDIGGTTIALDRLPSRVDNSTRPAVPGSLQTEVGCLRPVRGSRFDLHLRDECLEWHRCRHRRHALPGSLFVEHDE